MKNMFGLFLVVLGVLLLLKEVGIITGGFWGYVWPILLILFGLSLMSRDKKDEWCSWCWKKSNKNKDRVIDGQ